MNYRYLIGSFVNRLEISLLRALGPKILRHYPIGRHWPFDVLRFFGAQPMVVIDAGANVGMTSNYMRRFFPTATIHAFEPVADTFVALRKNLACDHKVICHRAALGGQNATQTIAVDPYSEKSTMVRLEEPGRSLEQVDMFTLDSFVAQQNLPAIDVLKIDVQGFETQVLLGARECFRQRRVRYVYAEVGFDNSDPETSFFPQLHEILTANSFVLCGFYEHFRYGNNKQRLGFCNALYGLHQS